MCKSGVLRKGMFISDTNGLGEGCVDMVSQPDFEEQGKDLDMYKQLKEEVMWEFSGGPSS